MAGIQAIHYFFPAKKITVDQLAEYPKFDTGKAKFFSNLGIKEIAAGEDTHALSLAIPAIKKLLAAQKMSPDKIDAFILLQSRSPQYLLSSEVAYVQKECGITTPFAFTLSDLGCVNSSMAIKVATHLIESNAHIKNILIAYGSHPFSEERCRYPVTIIGDGGVAALISTKASAKIAGIEIASNGEYWDLFKVDYRNNAAKDWATVCRDTHDYSFKLAIESKNQFEKINKTLLRKCKIKPEKIDHFIMQNISVNAFQFYEDAFDVKFSKSCYQNLEYYGHIGSMDIFLNIQTGLESGEFAKKQTILVMNNSPVAAWSSFILKT